MLTAKNDKPIETIPKELKVKTSGETKLPGNYLKPKTQKTY